MYMGTCGIWYSQGAPILSASSSSQKNEAKLQSQPNFPERKTKPKNGWRSKTSHCTEKKEEKTHPFMHLWPEVIQNHVARESPLPRVIQTPPGPGWWDLWRPHWTHLKKMFRVRLGVGRVVTFGLSFRLTVLWGLFSAVCRFVCFRLEKRYSRICGGISFFTFLTRSYLVVLETLIRWLKQYCENSVQQIRNQDKHTLKYI